MRPCRICGGLVNCLVLIWCWTEDRRKPMRPEFDGAAFDRWMTREEEQSEMLHQVEHSCGHIWGYDTADEPPADQPCWRCRPCPCCGEKMWDCTCEPGDPFPDEE